jgi:hypothetical protein
VWDRAVSALLKALGRIFRNTPDLGTLSIFFVWVLLLLAVAAVMLWLWRTMRPGFNPGLALQGGHEAWVSSTPWQTWLQGARDAAARGDFREAIHLGYWCGIAALEEAGAWKPDCARTPREYLRLASSASFYPGLQALTREFERIWYAQQPATAADFEVFRLYLERIGCQ